MKGSVLSEAISIINGKRQDQYGDPEDSFELIAQFWSLWLGCEVCKQDVAMMMVLFKQVRERNQHKRDNCRDAAGYLGIYADMEHNAGKDCVKQFNEEDR